MALESLTLSFSKVGAASGVLVNRIRVGTTDAPIHLKNPKKNLTERTKWIPLGRIARPEEIAECVFILASEESSFVTGAILTTAGGE